VPWDSWAEGTTTSLSSESRDALLESGRPFRLVMTVTAPRGRVNSRTAAGVCAGVRVVATVNTHPSTIVLCHLLSGSLSLAPACAEEVPPLGIGTSLPTSGLLLGALAFEKSLDALH
jgi:hypothetical protein